MRLPAQAPKKVRNSPPSGRVNPNTSLKVFLPVVPRNLPPLQTNFEIAIMSTTGRWASATVSWLVDLLYDIMKGPIK
jgi:hypothetical protein